jgi:hypothetical protein
MGIRAFARRFRGCWTCFGIFALIAGIIVATWAIVEYYYVSDFTVTYSGALNGEISVGDVSFQCGFSGDAARIYLSEDWIAAGKGDDLLSSYLVILISAQIKPGMHSLKAWDNDVTSELERGEIVIGGRISGDGSSYFIGPLTTTAEKYVSGTISLDNIPNKPRKLIRGEFEIIFTDLELRGEFKFRTKGANYDCLR